MTISYGSTNEVITAKSAYNFSVENSDYSSSGIVFAPSNGAVELTAMDLTDGELSLESINLYGATDLTGQRRYKGGGEEDVYYLKDHLGNIRTILKDEKNNPAFSNKIRAEQFSLLSARDYFPFGSTMRSSNFGVKADVDKWRYQGKERDQETGYDYFEARYFDGDLGRFMQVDPMTEKFVTMNPFTAMGNNPLRVIDPDGREIWILYREKYKDKEGKEKYRMKKIRYSSNLKHTSKEVMKMVGILNNIGKTNVGDKLIKTLQKDNRKFDFKFGKIQDKSKNKKRYGNTSFLGSLKKNKLNSGKTTIDDKKIENSKGQRTLEETTTHEMVHIYDAIKDFRKEVEDSKKVHSRERKIGAGVRRQLEKKTSKNIINKGSKN